MAKKSLRRGASEAGLTITSMMDMMTIILVFLLKSYSTEDVSVKQNEDLQIPISSAEKSPKLAVNLVVSRNAIIVDGKRIVGLEVVADEETGEPMLRVPPEAKKGQMISDLYDTLVDKAETAKTQGSQAQNDELGFKGQILLQCDKTLPFAVIREVMYTAGQAQFGEFRFVVIKSSE